MSAILAIDAAGASFAVALLVDDVVVREVVSDTTRDHSRKLLPAIGDVMGSMAVHLDAVAVIRGPGSYAGVRVGLAAAAGFAMARALPIIGIGTLEAVGAAAGPGTWVATHPAGRGTVAAQLYRDGVAAGPLHTAAERGVFDWPTAGEGAAPAGGREVTTLERCRAAARLAPARLASAEYAIPSALYLRDPHITAPRTRPAIAS